MTTINKNGVHASHCCFMHGCKYGDEDCPVELKQVNQYYSCEQCTDDYDSLQDHINALEKKIESLKLIQKIIQKN